MDDIKLELSIPSDDDGFVLLKCEHCGSFFKLTPNDIEDEGVLHIFCPGCGLISESYLTDDVIDLATSMVTNTINDLIFDSFKSMEKHNKNSFIKFKAGKKPSHETENPIRSGVEALEVVSFQCCRKKAKVKPLLKMTGCYCPFCGVKYYEFE